ncbi:MAG: hypothetical protein ACI4DN_09440 [Lachnospiraceae bacterium]
MIAVSEQAKEEWKQERETKAELLAGRIEEKLNLFHKKNFQFRAILKGNPTLRSEKFKEALEELKAAMEEHKKKQ